MSRYLSDYLTEDQQNGIFNSIGEISIITAPTGAGKTTLIMDNTIRTVGDAPNFGKKKTLILCNRTALYTQIRLDLSMKLNKTQLKDGIDKEFIQNKLIHVMTYQKLYISMLENPEFLNDYQVVICDESHYFINDGWNHITHMTLEKLIKHSKTNTVLFFSATTKEIKQWLDIYKEKNRLEKSVYKDIIPIEDAVKLGYNDRLEIITTDMDAEEIIKSMPQGEKFIWFMNENVSKDRIIKKSKEYSNVGYIHSMWVTAKGGKIYPDSEMKMKFDELVLNKTFKTNGLITNSSMDNGVSIHDSQVKHIVLDHIGNMTQIVQMIGRKRFNPNNTEDRCKVYICCGNQKEFKRIYEKYKSMQEPSMDYRHVEEGKLSLDDFLDKYNDQVERNTVRIKTNTEDVVLDALKQFKKKLDRKEIDRNFPFMFIYKFGYELVTIANDCYRYNIDDRVITLENIFNHQKEGYSIQEFLCMTLRLNYSKVDYRTTKETINQKRKQGEKEIPYILDRYTGKLLKSVELSKIRTDLCKKYSLRNSSKKILNQGEFKLYINTLGFDIEKIIENRKTYYKLYK